MYLHFGEVESKTELLNDLWVAASALLHSKIKKKKLKLSLTVLLEIIQLVVYCDFL